MDHVVRARAVAEKGPQRVREGAHERAYRAHGADMRAREPVAGVNQRQEREQARQTHGGGEVVELALPERGERWPHGWARRALRRDAREVFMIPMVCVGCFMCVKEIHYVVFGSPLSVGVLSSGLC